MDIYCPRCLEPWDTDSLHDMVAEGTAASYSAAMRAFRRLGCQAFSGEYFGNIPECAPVPGGAIVAALADALGSDVDGLAAELADVFGPGGVARF